MQHDETPVERTRRLLAEAEKVREEAREVEYFRVCVRLRARPQIEEPQQPLLKRMFFKGSRDNRDTMLTHKQTNAFYEWTYSYQKQLIEKANALEAAAMNKEVHDDGY